MTIAVLALQGAFLEHEQVLHKLNIDTIELRKASDLDRPFDGLILPGGESSVQGKLLRELGMYEKLKKMIADGLPVLATCAGLILLAEEISNDTRTCFATLPVTVKRNAYGRQLGSFHYDGSVKGIGTFPMEFIRAPYIEKAAKDVTILAKVDGNIVAVQYKNQLAFAFHPELGGDFRIHEAFISLINANSACKFISRAI